MWQCFWLESWKFLLVLKILPGYPELIKHYFLLYCIVFHTKLVLISYFFFQFHKCKLAKSWLILIFFIGFLREGRQKKYSPRKTFVNCLTCANLLFFCCCYSTVSFVSDYVIVPQRKERVMEGYLTNFFDALPSLLHATQLEISLFIWNFFYFSLRLTWLWQMYKIDIVCLKRHLGKSSSQSFVFESKY